MSLKKKLFGETFVYGLSRYASFLAAIFLTPIYTRLLTKEDYGVMDIFNKWNGFALAIIPLGLYSALVRFYPDIEHDLFKKKQYLGSIFTSLLVLSALYILIMLSIKSYFLDAFIEKSFLNIDHIYSFSFGIVIFQLLFQYCLQLLRVHHKSMQFAALSLLNFSILTSLGFYFIYYGKENIVGFFKASILAAITSLVVAIMVVRKEIYFNFNLEITKKMLRYSVHFLSVFFLFQATDLFDRYLIRQHFNLDEIGIYSIGSRISGFILLATGSLALAWMPRAMEIKDQENAGNIYRKMFNGYVIAGFLMVCFLIVFRSELIRFFAPDYGASADIIVLLSVFNFLMGFVYVFTIGIQISKKSWIVSVAGFFAIAVKIIGSIMLIGNYGITGIAWASIFEALVWVAIQHFFSQKFHRIPFNYYILIFILFFAPVFYLTRNLEGGEYALLLKGLMFSLISITSLLFFKKLAYR